jgi:hypothetical protein
MGRYPPAPVGRSKFTTIKTIKQYTPGMKKKGRHIIPDMEESTRTGCVWTVIFTALAFLAFCIFVVLRAPLR